MARPVFPGQYPDPNIQADNYGPAGGYQTGPAAPVSRPFDQSAQWQTTQTVQGYPQQWSQAAGPSPSPPTSFTSPPTQYNPSAYGPMPSGQPPQYLPPPPTYAQAQQQQVQQQQVPQQQVQQQQVPQQQVQQQQVPQQQVQQQQVPQQHVQPLPYGERPPSIAHPAPINPPTRPPLSSIPSGYQAEIQQNQQGWPQHPPYSSQPPSQRYEPPNQGEQQPYNYAGYVNQPSNTPPPPPPKESQGPYAPPPPPKPYAPSTQHEPSFGPSPVLSSPSSARPGYAQSFPPAQQHYPPPVAPPQSGPPAWAAAQPPMSGAPASGGIGQQQLPSSQQSDYSARPGSQQGVQDRPATAFQGQQAQSTHVATQSQSGPLPVSPTPSHAPVTPPNPPYVPPNWQLQNAAAPRPVQGPPHESQYDYQAEPVSPIHRQSVISDRTEDAGFNVSAGPSRTASMISRHSITAADIPSHPPVPEKQPVPPANTNTTRASAFSFGGPGDWEYYGAGPEEIDDTAMYGSKGGAETPEAQHSHGIELPSEPSPTREESRPPGPQPEAAPDHRPAAQMPQRSNETLPQSPPVGKPNQPNPEAQHTDATILAPAPARPSQGPAPTGHAPGAHPQSRPGAEPPKMAGGRVSSSPRTNGTAVRTGRPAPPGKPATASTPPVTKPVARDETAFEKLRLVVKNLQTTVSQQKSNLEKMAQQLNDQRQLVQKEAAEAQRARDEVQGLQKNLEDISAAHTTATDDLNAQRDHLQSKLAEAETALATAKETHENERNNLRANLNQAEAATASAKETHHTECEALRAEITDKEESMFSAKADAERLADELEKQTQRVKELELQIEAEKNKPAPVVDIAPGLDPWFKGSLERFRDILYAEAAAPTVQEKRKAFIDFVNSESSLRGVDLSFEPSGEAKGFAPQPSIPPSDSSAKPSENKPQRPSIKSSPTDYIVVEPDQYSPGGRPIVHRASVQEPTEIPPSVATATNVPLGEDTTASAPVDKSERATAPPAQTYKPYRTDTFNPGEAPHSQDSEAAMRRPTIDTNQPVYKPFTYQPNPSGITSPTAPPLNRASISAPAVPTQSTIHRPQEETFLEDLPQPPKQRKPSAEPDAPKDPVMVPPPLKPKTPAPPAEAKPPNTNTQDKARMTPLERLAAVLPPRPPAREGAPAPAQSSPRLEALKQTLAELPSDYAWIQDLTHAHDVKASAARAHLADERSRRLAQVEQRSNELFEAGEIGYEDIAVLEEKAQDAERERDAREEKEEYERYAKEVFEVVFGRLQEEIGKVMQLEGQVTAVVDDAVAERRTLDVERHAHIVDAIGVLLAVHRSLEQRHDKVAEAVRERDKSYKRMQTKPLYAKGDIAEMKKLEKHFEVNERKAEVRIKLEKVMRCKAVWTTVEHAVTRTTKQNEEYLDAILGDIDGIRDDKNAIETSEEMVNTRRILLMDARDFLRRLSKSAAQLMLHFERVEMDLNDCEYEVSVASAKAKGDSPEVLQNLKKDKATEDGQLKAESRKRLIHIEEDLRDAEASINAALGTREANEEIDKKARLDAALREAKRRNQEAV